MSRIARHATRALSANDVSTDPAGAAPASAATEGARVPHSDLLEPPMQDIDMRDWRSLNRAVEAGYCDAAKKLQDSEHVLSSLAH